MPALRHSILPILALGGAILLIVFLLSSVTTAQEQDDQSDPCARQAVGDVQFRGVRSQFVTAGDKPLAVPAGETTPQISVRPGDTLPFEFRYYICTVADIPRLEGDVQLANDSGVLMHIPGSSRLSAQPPVGISQKLFLNLSKAADKEQEKTPAVTASEEQTESSDIDRSPFLSFVNTEAINRTSVVSIKWKLAVSNCAPIGSQSSVTLHTVLDLPVGQPGEDGSYEFRPMEGSRSMTMMVAPHSALSVTSYRASIEVSDTTPSPGWTEEYKLQIANEGTGRQHRAVSIISHPKEIGPLIAAIPRTTVRQTISRLTGRHTRFHEVTDIRDWYINPAPGESVVFSWNDTIAFDASIGATFTLIAGAGHDTDRDGKAMGDDEVTKAQSTITITENKRGLVVTHRAASSRGGFEIYPEDVVDFTIHLRNPTSEPMTDLILELRYTHGIRYLAGSTSYRFQRHPITDPDALAKPLHQSDNWVTGWHITELKPNVELRIDYRAELDGDLVVPGDVMDVWALVSQDGSILADGNAGFTVSGRGELGISIDAPETALPGDVLTYTVNLTNNGDDSLEEVAFAVDMCKMSYVEGSEWVFTRFGEPIRGGIGIGTGSSMLSDYLADPRRNEPYRLERAIKPGETIEISFKVKLDEDVPLGTALTPTFHALGRATEGYQLESFEQVLAVGNEAATAKDLEAAKESIIFKTAQDLQEAEKSILQRITDWRFLTLEGLAALLGALVGVAMGYIKRDWISKMLSKISRWPA